MTIWIPHLTSEKRAHAAIADALADDIATGRLQDGDQLPTQRELAARLGVSLGTVTRAYGIARRRGLIRGETGRGTFVGRRGVDLFDPQAREGIDDAQMDVSWPLYAHDPDLGAALRRVADSPICDRLLRYQPNAGMSRHREAGSLWLRAYGMRVDPGNVLVCAGAQHALSVVLAAAAAPGDTVFCDALTYPGFRAAAERLHLHVVGIAMDRHGMIPDALAAECRLRRGRLVYTIPTIQNPMTPTLSETRRRDIAEVAEREGLMIVEDAVHHLLAHAPPPTVAAIAPERTFCIATLSKIVAGGLRVAFLSAPDSWVERLGRAIWATHWMTAPLCAEVASLWIGDGTAADVVTRKRREACTRLEILLEHLDSSRVRAQRGGYHAWLELHDEWNPTDFAHEARRRGAAVSPPEAFATPGEDLPRGVRISLSGPATRGALAAGARTLAELLHNGPGACPAIL